MTHAITVRLDDADHAVLSDVADLDLVLHPFDLVRDGADVAEITQRLRHRHATDSAYVSLARRLGTRVWTVDGPLFRGARDVGLPVRLIP